MSLKCILLIEILSLLVLPRVLFEHWSIDDIMKIYSSTERQTQLIVSLLDAAQVKSKLILSLNISLCILIIRSILYFQTFHFDGYVLEIWNQFVFAGANLPIVTSIVRFIAQKLKKHNLDIILAIPPSKGYF